MNTALINHCFRSVKVVYCGPAQTLDFKQIQAQIDDAYARGKMDAISEQEKRAAQTQQELEHAQRALLKKISTEYNGALYEIRSRLPKLVVILARKICSGLIWDAQAAQTMVEELIGEYASPEEPLEIFLSASDLELLLPLELTKTYPTVALKEDSTLGSGDCIVRSRFGTIDARLESKLAKIEHTLSESLQRND